MNVYTIKVTLVGIRPPIWRRLAVPAGLSLGRLHDVLQIAMGWTDSHLHQFERHGELFGVSDREFGLERTNEHSTRLDDVLKTKGDWMEYEYDFGDSWHHRVALERIDSSDGASAAVALAGKGACPPEDCGGIYGYTNLVDAMRNPKHPERDELLEWLGGRFDPLAFDLDGVNRRLRKLRLRELDARRPRRRSRGVWVLANPAGEDEAAAFRDDLKAKLADPAAILNDREVRYLTMQVSVALAQMPVSAAADVPPAEDIVRWSAVAARCRQARDERGWTIKDAAKALKITAKQVDAVEKGPVPGYRLEHAARYFRLLGIEKWIAKWAHANRELARRQGLGK